MNVKERQKGIGGSDVAAIMGLNPWATPLDVYYSKIVPIKEIDDKAKVDRLRAGQIAEEFIIKRYEEMENCKVKTDVGVLVHRNYEFMRGNVDGIREDQNVVVECKTVGGFPDQWQGKIPLYYKTQCAHYAMLTNCERVDLAAAFDRWMFKIFVYERDYPFEKEILQKCIDFWMNHVLKKVPPKSMTLKDFAKVSYQHNSVCTADNAILNVVESYRDMLARQKDMEKHAETLKVKVIAALKGHDTMVDEAGREILTYKARVQKRLDTKSLKENEPDTYEQYVKVSKYRTLKLSEGAKK